MNNNFVEIKDILVKVYIHQDFVEIKKLGQNVSFRIENVKRVSIENLGTKLRVDIGSKKDIFINLRNKKTIKNISDYLNKIISFNEFQEKQVIDNDKNSTQINLSFNKKFGNIVGTILLLSAFGALIGKSFMSSLVLLIVGSLITSFGYNFLKSKFKLSLSKNQRIIASLVLLILLLPLTSTPNGNGSSVHRETEVVKNANKSDTNNADQLARVGEDGYLKYDATTDSNQVICLGSTKEEYEQVGKALYAKDYIGLLEIPGAFCVGNGTKVQVVDSSFTLRRVRIVETYRDVDQDKLLMSGWVPVELVVKQ